MLLTLLLWPVIFLLSFGIGSACLQFIARLLRRQPQLQPYLLLSVIVGLALYSVVLGYLSLFIAIGPAVKWMFIAVSAGFLIKEWPRLRAPSFHARPIRCWYAAWVFPCWALPWSAPSK
jgi:O-antigen/teichoic acid export membrane protein